MSGPDDPHVWLAKAENDLLCIHNNLNDDRIPWDAICFHAQQAAEKLLKAYLVARGLIVPRTHDLLMLLGRCAEISQRFTTLQSECSLLNPYSVELRYPGSAPEPRETDGRAALLAAERIRTFILTEIPRR